ncbi:hypothetical protein ACFX5D_13375 [Flavobacterium sp. LB3P45]|jgi:hypothetical protein|uniref:Uncharacterized protein n=1 Tax=Flavobacterium fructosi TaxID=3230416 RepID=A0ABW6HPI3_9FLAO
MFKLILNLLLNRASAKEWQLQIGAHLLKKGCGFHIGQIIKEKKLYGKRYRVKVITGLFYDFNTNKINHTAENKVLDAD